MFRNTQQIRELARDTGSHFFDPETMRFFHSRVSAAVYGGRYFVTSERSEWPEVWGGRRRYTIRKATYDHGRFSIDTVGEFGQFATLAEATAEAKRLGGEA